MLFLRGAGIQLEELVPWVTPSNVSADAIAAAGSSRESSAVEPLRATALGIKEPCRLLGRIFVLAMCPHWALVASLLPTARDSFWWIFALVDACIVNFINDLAAVGLLLMGVRLRINWVLQQLFVAAFVASIAAVLAADAVGTRPQGFVEVLLRLVCVSHAVKGAVRPMRLYRHGRQAHERAKRTLLYSMAWCHLAVHVLLCSLSRNRLFDFSTLLLMLGPGAFAWLEFLRMGTELWEELRPDVFPAPMIIDRSRILESSVEALRSLPPGAFQSGIPPVAYLSGLATKASAADSEGCFTEMDQPGQEDGVDAGGLRRDWLNRVIAAAFNPVSGLVETTMVDGSMHARIRKGADQAKLEAVGKVIGLALRAQQPLGVDVCAPLAHLLAHRRLPQALEAVDRGLGGPSGKPKKSPLLDDLGGDAASAELELSIWQRLKLRHAGGRASRQRFLAASELLLLGFSREWLRWVSEDEYAYWERCLSEELPADDRAQLVTALGAETLDGQPVTLNNLPEHMARRALDELVLDVQEETLALWRGLHSIPGVKLPRLTREACESKRLRQCVEDEEEMRARKRPRQCASRQEAGAMHEAPTAAMSSQRGPCPSCATHAQQELADVAASPAVSEIVAAAVDTAGQTAPVTETAAHVSEGPVCEEATARKRKFEGEVHDGDAVPRPQGAPVGASAHSAVREPPAKRRRLAHQPSPLQLIISGDRNIPVEEWKQLTTCEVGGASMAAQDEQTLGWFWAHVAELGAEGRANLLEWITGFRRLPPGGFPPPTTRMTISLVKSSDRLPVAHTCSLQLDLPAEYDSAATLKAKLTQAVEHKQFLLA